MKDINDLFNSIEEIPGLGKKYRRGEIFYFFEDSRSRIDITVLTDAHKPALSCPFCDTELTPVMENNRREKRILGHCQLCGRNIIGWYSIISNSWLWERINIVNKDDVLNKITKEERFDESFLSHFIGSDEDGTWRSSNSYPVFLEKKNAFVEKRNKKQLVESMKKYYDEKEPTTLAYERRNEKLYSERPLGMRPKQRKRKDHGFFS